MLQPELKVKAEKIHRAHWNEEAWRRLRVDPGRPDSAWPSVLGTS